MAADAESGVKQSAWLLLGQSKSGDDMELDFDDTALRGLQRYVGLVSQASALSGECWWVQADDLACAYIALDGRFSCCPDRDVALLWDESQGWSAATETHGGEDLLVVAHLGQDLLPPP
jgi:hypothetical protein